MCDHIHIRKWDTVLVHAGFHPYQAWQSQPRDLISEIQTLGQNNRPQRRADDPIAPSWADFWTGPPFVIYGHTPRFAVYEKPSSLGIDTGCVIGGKLTACVLPEREIIQVPAVKVYFRR
jgi:serine/threonine protein phosphatase 1